MIAASDISLTNENVKVSLVDSDVTAFSSAHEFYSDLVDTSNGIIATANLDNCTVVDSTLDADDVVFDSVNTAIESEALMIWIDTADANTSRLVAWLDSNIDGLPITPDGSNVAITWSTSGIFKI